MLVESIGFGAVVGGVLLAQSMAGKKGKTDRDKIEEVFENVGFSVRKGSGKNVYDEYPKFINEGEWEHGHSYVYQLPKGIPFTATEKIRPAIEDALNKPVSMEWSGRLHIKVSKIRIPENVPYNRIQGTKWNVHLGLSPFGEKFIDFDKYPHMIVGGMTRKGKTVLLKSLTTSLCLQNNEYAQFYMLDLKGGLEFNSYANLKQVKGIADDVNSSLKILEQINHDMDKWMQTFKEQRYSNITESGVSRRVFIIVDEGAELAKTPSTPREDKKKMDRCQAILSRIARIGGALGYRLIFCTQYPTGDTLPRQIKQNADTKVCFALPTEVASRVVLDEVGAEQLPRIPGRAILRTDETTTIQVPYDNDFMQYLKEWECEQHQEASQTDGGNIEESRQAPVHDKKPAAEASPFRY